MTAKQREWLQYTSNIRYQNVNVLREKTMTAGHFSHTPLRTSLAFEPRQRIQRIGAEPQFGHVGCGSTGACTFAFAAIAARSLAHCPIAADGASLREMRTNNG